MTLMINFVTSFNTGKLVLEQDGNVNNGGSTPTGVQRITRQRRKFLTSGDLNCFIVNVLLCISLKLTYSRCRKLQYSSLKCAISEVMKPSVLNGHAGLFCVQRQNIIILTIRNVVMPAEFDI